MVQCHIFKPSKLCAVIEVDRTRTNDLGEGGDGMRLKGAVERLNEDEDEDDDFDYEEYMV